MSDLDPPLGRTIGEEVARTYYWDTYHWDDDALFRTYLQDLPEPTEVVEVGRIRARVKCVRGRIRELTRVCNDLQPHKISLLDRDLAKEQFKRKVLRWQLFRINELPVELVVEIFRFVVMSTPITTDNVLQKLRLTWVCKRFRTVALGDGTLWSYILFTDPPPWTRSLTFLERSGECPLDLCINDISTPAAPLPVIDHHQIQFLMGKVLTKAHTIRTMVFSFTDWLGPWFVLKMLQNTPTPRLESFRLDRGWEPYLWDTTHFNNPESREPIPFCGGSESGIQRLLLNGISVNWSSIHTAKLKALDICRLAPEVSPTVQQFRALLQAPNLMKLYLHSAVPLFPSGQPLPEPVYMPNLIELRLGGMSLEATQDILSSMRAPNVRIFALIVMLGQDYTPLFEMLIDRFPEVLLLILTAVNLEDNETAQEYFVRWIDSMLKLRVLHLDSPPDSVVFDYLLADPWPYRDPTHPCRQPIPGTDRVIGRSWLMVDLRTVVVDKVTPEDLAHFARRRYADQSPPPLLLVPHQTWVQWTPEQRAEMSFLENYLHLIFDHPHHVTAEEAAIRKELEEAAHIRERASVA